MIKCTPLLFQNSTFGEWLGGFTVGSLIMLVGIVILVVFYIKGSRKK